MNMTEWSAGLALALACAPPGAAAADAGGKSWREPLTGMEFVQLKAGCYMMGSPANESGRYDDETPHRACVDGFWLGKYEVTNRQFAVFVAATRYRTTSEDRGEGFGIGGRNAADWGWKAGIDWRHPLWPGDTIADKMEHPVVQVSWNDAKAFVDWLNGKHGGTYRFRLPREDEWEYACRAGAATARPWGKDPDRACRHASVADSTAKRTWPPMEAHNCTDGYTSSAPVGRLAPNRWGLHDMLGNAWEWTEDAYAEYGGDAGAEGEDDHFLLRVLRGGSWAYGPRQVRCAFRNVMSPTGRSYSAGFRVVKEASSRGN